MSGGRLDGADAGAAYESPALGRSDAVRRPTAAQDSQAAAAAPFSKRILHIAYSSGTAMG